MQFEEKQNRFVQMTIFRAYLILLSFLLSASLGQESMACSMYKVTFDGKTMVGCNEDAWRTTSRMWFEKAINSNEYGAAFTGSRLVNNNRTAPQSGMNVAGLVFSRLAAYHPEQKNPFPNRAKIDNEVDYLSDILHKCANINDVKKYIRQFDHSLFREDVFIYIDKSGKYLIVEPYKLIEGNEPNYVLSNFCPSITDSQIARKFERYRNGEDYLEKNKVNSTLSFCTSLSDTMHVCRNRNGDGTLLTSIWDTKELLVNLYFYHQFDTTVQFDLREELSKGDHSVLIPDIFPVNPEFERLVNYKTPFNTPIIRILMIPLAGTLFLFALILGVFHFRNKKSGLFLVISAINLILTAYLFILATNSYIFYFDAPYIHHDSLIITASSYTPFLLLLSILPIFYFSFHRFSSGKFHALLKTVLISNNLIYVMLISGFIYWGLYIFWN